MFIKSYYIPWAFNNCIKLLYAYDVYKHQVSDIFHQIFILDSILISKMLLFFIVKHHIVVTLHLFGSLHPTSYIWWKLSPMQPDIAQSSENFHKSTSRLISWFIDLNFFGTMSHHVTTWSPHVVLNTLHCVPITYLRPQFISLAPLKVSTLAGVQHSLPS